MILARWFIAYIYNGMERDSTNHNQWSELLTLVLEMYICEQWRQ